MACQLFGAKPLPEPMLAYPLETNFNEIWIEILTFSFKVYLKMSSAKMAAILSRGRWVEFEAIMSI